MFAIVVGAAALVLVAPAGAVLDATFAAGVLTVTGDGEGDTVSIACSGDEVVVDGASMPDEPIPCADVASIVVQPGGGDDTVDLRNVTEDVFTGLTGVTVHGGAGNDFITGSPFEDEIEGGADDDTLFVNGTDFDDEFVVTATEVQDVVSGRDDSVTGLEFFSFHVGIGVNRVDASAGPGNYTMFGDTDSDELIGGSGDDFIDGGDGADVLIGGGGSDTVKGEEGADELGGGDGADVLTGGVGNDVLDGGDGADTFQLNVGDGADGVAGGGGFDELVLDGSSDPELPDALTVRNADLTLGAETSTHAGVELVRFRAADGDDVLDARGASVPVEFVGGAGDDDLFGGQGNDLLFGDDGFDRLDGGPGADVLDGGGGADLYEAAFALRAITATIDDSGADGDDELTVADFCSTLTIAEDLAGTWTVTKKTTGSKVEATGLEGDPTCATDPPSPPPPPPTPPASPPPPPASPPPPPPSATPPPPASPPPAQPRKPTVKKVVKITICHRRKTIKVTKAQLKKHLKHKDKRGACRPKKTTKKR